MTHKSVSDPASPRSLAARMGNLASNVLVSGVILIVGLAFGREIITWWRADASKETTSPIASVVGEYSPLEASDQQLLEFGDFPFVLNRQEFSGNVNEVLLQLRKASHRAVASAQPLAETPSDAEVSMIAAAKRLKPAEEQTNDWSIYEIGSPMPMVVGVRSFDSQVATAEQRVVSWGLAVPDATPEGEPQTNWTLFTYSSDATNLVTPDQVVRIGPPGGQRTLALRTEHGDAVIGYAGRGTVASWTKFYDDSFPDSPSVPNSSWQAEVGTWRRRFEVANKETVDVVIHQDGADTLHSLVISSPARVSDR